MSSPLTNEQRIDLIVQRRLDHDRAFKHAKNAEQAGQREDQIVREVEAEVLDREHEQREADDPSIEAAFGE